MKSLAEAIEATPARAAMVVCLPYSDSQIAKQSGKSWGPVETVCQTREEADTLFAALCASGEVEWAELYYADARYPFGRIRMNEWKDTP